MSVIRMKASDTEKPQSGGAMDRVVEKKGLSKQVKIALAAAAVVIAAIVFYMMAPSGSAQTVAADRVTISPVTKGTFDDFLPLRARVTPLVSVYLDAVEGGRVEQVLVEDGAMVQKGQLLAVLSNSDRYHSALLTPGIGRAPDGSVTLGSRHPSSAIQIGARSSSAVSRS